MHIDTLTFIKACIKHRKILWTYHVNMRLKKRFIPRDAILFSVNTYEIIEEYPRDKYLPSYLIYAAYKDLIIHIQIAVDINNDSITIVTAYRPTLDKWEMDLKTRRKP
ncbi:MAG: hypothetical protein A2Y62_07575 [Candidatus Fischerbacteria bacterium RBG_13_37_8]|uniref:DUF4258 domain-containing protein n=1 Tax=Candidatus Fischerbacteria bacterium RBG_13_37_8 TaxID=1817863 RepID=A0A1F5VI57_9BACT|nr:MAG: hypothetical protein A2Y62_07575 [Candidatus Fischerbacteria bacterium RBG_13_37_8]